MVNTRRLVVLTGAGISVESGLPSFRGSDGLWQGHRIEDVATPQAFAREPETVQRFYDERRRQLLDGAIKPNQAHQALAELERHWPGEFLLVTQNIDNLHERAGTHRLIHMHGELLKARCTGCGVIHSWLDDLLPTHQCAACSAIDCLRPHIVWFGEMPFALDAIGAALDKADIFVSIGTSGQVYPAAGFVERFHRDGGRRSIELNLEPSLVSDSFEEHRFGAAGEQVPELVRELLAAHAKSVPPPDQNDM